MKGDTIARVRARAYKAKGRAYERQWAEKRQRDQLHDEELDRAQEVAMNNRPFWKKWLGVFP